MKSSLFLVLCALYLVPSVFLLSRAALSAPGQELVIETNSQGRVVRLGNISTPGNDSGCIPQANIDGVISDIDVSTDEHGSSVISGIHFRSYDPGHRSGYYNISPGIRNSREISSFLTSGKSVSISYFATGVSCRFLFITNIKSIEEDLIEMDPSSSSWTIDGPADTYVNIQYSGDDLPNGITTFGGHLVSSNFAISEMQEREQRMLWFKRQVGRDTQGKPIWRVSDVLLFSPEVSQKLDSSYYTLMGGLNQFACSQNYEVTPEIIAVAVYEENLELQEKIEYAWKANTETGRFEEISADSVLCPNPGWGV